MAITLAQARAYISKAIDKDKSGTINNWSEGNAFTDWFGRNCANKNFDKSARAHLYSIYTEVQTAMYSDPLGGGSDQEFEGVYY